MKNFLNWIAGFSLAAFALCLFAIQASGQGVISATFGPSVITLAANPSNVFSFPANSTNYFPTNVVVTNIVTNAITSVVTTNVFTNTLTGIIDNSKEGTLTLQAGYICYSNAFGSNVIWQIEPGVDLVNWDTNNPTFWWTNNPGSTTGQGSNGVVQTTNFSELMCSGIPYYKVNALVNLNTNPIYAYLTNSGAGSGSLTYATNNTGTNFQFLQAGSKHFTLR